MQTIKQNIGTEQVPLFFAMKTWISIGGEWRMFNNKNTEKNVMENNKEFDHRLDPEVINKIKQIIEEEWNRCSTKRTIHIFDNIEQEPNN